MKNKITLITLFLFQSLSFSQITDLVTNLPTGMNGGILDLVLKVNSLYFTSFGDKKLYEIDLADNSYNVIYTFTEKPFSLFLDNELLYIGCQQDDRTYSINLSDSILSTTLITNISGAMQKIDDDLYIGRYGESKIVKYNLITNITTDVLIGYKPNYFTLHNDDLYFSSNYTDTLYKYNLNNSSITMVVSNLNNPSGISYNDDYFFIGESTTDKILIYDIADFSPNGFYTLENNSYPNGILVNDDELFFIQTNIGKISKIKFSTLNLHDIPENENIILFPNPTSDYINVLNSNGKEFEIYNSLGQKVKYGKISNNIINVNYLNKGIYFLKIDNVKHKIIIK
tara:strand:+ start:26857 stop:27879 length:1023 start_codon:yes stop_codon:yes gene_type:complete